MGPWRLIMGAFCSLLVLTPGTEASCMTETHDCDASEGEVCADTVDSFHCICAPGYANITIL